MLIQAQNKKFIILALKGEQVQIGDVFNNKLITYLQRDDYSTMVRYHTGEYDYYLNNADVIIKRLEVE